MSTNYSELVDLKTLLELKNAAPQVMEVPWDTARMVVQGLRELSREGESHVDVQGRRYWEATLKAIHAAGRLPEATAMMVVGKACRSMGLPRWRENDGYHTSWSDGQLAILVKYFKA